VTIETQPYLGFTSGWPDGYDGWGAAVNANWRGVSTLMGFVTFEAPRNSPPGSPAWGDRYIVGSAGTGAFSGHNNALAVYDKDESGTLAWRFTTPHSGLSVHVVSSTATDPIVPMRYRGGAWVYEFGNSGTAAATGPLTVLTSGGIHPGTMDAAGFLTFDPATGTFGSHVAAADLVVSGGTLGFRSSQVNLSEFGYFQSGTMSNAQLCVIVPYSTDKIIPANWTNVFAVEFYGTHWPAASMSLAVSTLKGGTLTARGTITINTGGTLSVSGGPTIDTTVTAPFAVVIEGQATADVSAKDFAISGYLKKA